MTPLEILEFDAKHHYDGVTFDEALDAYEQTICNPNLRMLQYGNTMLSLNNMSGEFHFINAADPMTFVDNIKVLFAEAKALGFRDVHTDFTNPKIIEVAKLTKLDILIGETSPGQYLMIVRL